MTSIELVHDDITKVPADAIVNAANATLLGGGGVDGAIHRAGGPTIVAACREIRARQGDLTTGDAVVTTAGRLPARHVIHTVGPIWGAVDEAEAAALLASCYERSLELAAANECASVTFPNISTGVYHFPKALAADTAIAAVTRWVEDHPDVLDTITFVCFDDENHALYRERLG